MSGLTAFVLGATGETGKELLNILASNKAFTRIAVIGRRKLELNEEKFANVEQNVVDFEHLEDYGSAFEGFGIGYCCLGTTRGKSGASGFVKVDRDYVVQSAQLAKQAGCKQFHLLTAQGSNKNSWFLYPRTKGEVEEKVAEMEFDKLCIYRPGLLLCDRQESRVLEKVLQVTIGSVDRWRKVSIPTKAVAQAMVNCTLQPISDKPVDILEHSQIFNTSQND
ncbi:oxidoreductase HTATIP2-like [Daphnia carinata]|uniref:oxidoreductase HTATIP2-like n=1 Tax=Daphnia carinata TaxID=120202 RepID=UPI00258113B1|nr:oxidoreductase HTATIP2-like [Daphnia carinata]